MTLEEKLNYLQASSMEDARARGNEIIKEHQDALDHIFKEHQETARRQAELTIKSETLKFRQSLNKAVARSQMEYKQEQGKCQTELKNRLFQQVRTQLEAYMKTEAYKELLVARIQKSLAFANGEDVIIYLNPSDESLRQYLEEQTGTTLTISQEDFLGGIRAVMQKRRILIDYSFHSALLEEYEKFLFLGGDTDA